MRRSMLAIALSAFLAWTLRSVTHVAAQPRPPDRPFPDTPSAPPTDWEPKMEVPVIHTNMTGTIQVNCKA